MMSLRSGKIALRQEESTLRLENVPYPKMLYMSPNNQHANLHQPAKFHVIIMQNLQKLSIIVKSMMTFV